MSHPPPFGDATLGLHAGQQPDPTHGSTVPPIHFTTAFALADTDQAAARLNLEQVGHVDSGLSNPTVAVLEERIAALEGGVGAVATASGTAALHLAITTLMGQGGHVVASRTLDGRSRALLAHTLPRFGITTTFVDGRSPLAWGAAIGPATRLFLGPAIGDPGTEVMDIPTIAAVAHQHGLPLLVDASLASPVLQKPIELGADLVVHSADAYLGGHGVALGGLLVDGGRFDWHAGRPFPTLTEPWEGLHGITFADESPITAFLLRARHEGLAHFGASLSPINAFHILQGQETLSLRMTAHSAAALAVASHLARHPAVARVSYPGLPDHPDHALASRLLPAGAGGVLSFDLMGGLASTRAFMAGLRLCTHQAPTGGTRSTVSHPASTSHFRFPPVEQAAVGIGPGTLRLAVGLETREDLLDDLDRSLHAVAKTLQA